MASVGEVLVLAAMWTTPAWLTTPPEFTVIVPLLTKVPADWLKVPVTEAAVIEFEPPDCLNVAPELMIRVPVVSAIVPPELVMLELPDIVILPATTSVPPETLIVAAAPVPVAPIATVWAFAVPLLMTG